MAQHQTQNRMINSPARAGSPVRRRVLLVNHFAFPDLSATSQMVGGLAAALSAHGHDVLVMAGRRLHDQRHERLPKHDAWEGVRIRRVSSGGFGRGCLWSRAGGYAAFHAAAAWGVAAMARRDDIVVCLTDPPMLSVSLAPVIRARRAVLINWVQDLFPEVASSLGLKGTQGAAGQILQAARDRSLRGARMNVVLGERMAERLAARGIPADRIRVIHNYADGASVRPIPNGHNRLRWDWGLQDRFVVGYSGNMGRAHEFGTVLSAAEALADDPGIVFLFVGRGHYHAEIAGAAAARGLGNVLFQPLQPAARLAETLAAIDLHLVSLRPELEGLIVPSKIYGIAAAGRPGLFVGDPDGEVARLLLRHRCGMAVRIGDVRGLVDALVMLRGDPALRAALGANARTAFLREFDRPVAAATWLRLIDEITGTVPIGDHLPSTAGAPAKAVSTVPG